MLRAFAVFALAALPLRAASLRPGLPALSLRLEGIFGQPTGLLGVRGGGGIGSLAFGIQATLDATPVSPYIEFAVVDLTPQKTLGYSIATRTGLGADYHLSRSWLIGLVVRTLIAVNADSDLSRNLVTTGGTEAALRFTYLPGDN